MNAMGDAFKKMKKGGPKKPAPEGSPAEEAQETPMAEKMEQDKGEGDRAPSAHAHSAASEPIHGDQMHGELKPEHLIEILKQLLNGHNGAPQSFDGLAQGYIHNNISSLQKPKKI